MHFQRFRKKDKKLGNETTNEDLWNLLQGVFWTTNALPRESFYSLEGHSSVLCCCFSTDERERYPRITFAFCACIRCTVTIFTFEKEEDQKMGKKEQGIRGRSKRQHLCGVHRDGVVA